MEDLCSLLFELSNEDRLRILIQLKKEPMNVTKLSKELRLSTQEISRHLSRLAEVGLTKKDVNGHIHLTPYGELSLRQLQGQKFVVKYKDYFNSHLLERLPTEFVSRIGELADSKYVNEVTAVFYALGKMYQEAEGYMWSMVDQYFHDEPRWGTEQFKRGVTARTIEGRDFGFTVDVDDFRSTMGRSVLEL